jgi:hypothetical protein
LKITKYHLVHILEEVDMSGNHTKSSEQVIPEVIVLANLREWRDKFNQNPLDSEVIAQGMVTLSEIGESALIQAVRYGIKVEEVHESQQEVHEKLELIQSKLDTAILRFEGTALVYEHESESVATELKGLQEGVQEVRGMLQALLDHFGIQFSSP